MPYFSLLLFLSGVSLPILQGLKLIYWKAILGIFINPSRTLLLPAQSFDIVWHCQWPFRFDFVSQLWLTKGQRNFQTSVQDFIKGKLRANYIRPVNRLTIEFVYVYKYVSYLFLFDIILYLYASNKYVAGKCFATYVGHWAQLPIWQNCHLQRFGCWSSIALSFLCFDWKLSFLIEKFELIPIFHFGSTDRICIHINM